MLPNQPRIFLSYARADDEPFVKRLYEDLTTHGHTVWWDRLAMPSRALSFLQEIRDAVAAVERLIFVIGPKAVTSDYVYPEWKFAFDSCKVITPILRLGDYPLVPDELKNLHCPDFRLTRRYEDALAELLRILNDPVLPLGDLRNVPDQPPHFLPRPAALTELSSTVLADVNRPTVITSAKQTTALQGMGGIGKSVIGAAFARTCSTRRAFGDGIFWLAIGQTPNLVDRLWDIGRAFAGERQNYLDAKAARQDLSLRLQDKTCLIILDDVWSVRAVEPFVNALGPRCCLLITTRDGGLASSLGAQLLAVDLLADNEARCLLADWAGQAVETLPHEASAVASECGNLPFALALAGALARSEEQASIPWGDILAALREADLTYLEEQLPNYPYPTILKALSVSVEALGQEDALAKRCYLELAIFPAQTAIPEAAALTLWQHTQGINERTGHKLLAMLARKALLRLTGDAPNRQITLHDLQYDYLGAVQDDLTSLHQQLLAAYQQHCPNGWASAPNDGYFFQHLAHHLILAQRSAELRQLLLDYTWLQAKLAATDASALVADYTHLVNDPVVQRLGRTLGQAAYILAQDPQQLTSQLLGRLLNDPDLAIQALLQQATTSQQRPWLRPLTPSLSDPSELRLTLNGHTDSITGVAVTGDGRLAVSASNDETLKVWDLTSGREVRTLAGHTDSVTGVAMPEDGRLAISASSDHTLKVWDLVNGREIHTLTGHTDKVAGVAVTGDGHLAISASWDETLKVWDLVNGQEMHTLNGHKSKVTGVAVAGDGHLAISASTDATLRVWDLVSGQEIHTLVGHTNSVNGVAVTKDGRLAVSASYEHNLKVWDMTSGREIHTLAGHAGEVNGVAVTGDGRVAVSASWDMTLKVWDIRDILSVSVANGQDVNTMLAHTNAVTGVAVTGDGRLVISASWDMTLKVWDVTSGQELYPLRGHTGQVNGVAVTGDGRVAVSASWDKTLKIWNVVSGQEVHTLAGHTDSVYGVAVTNDGRLAVSASRDKTLKVWDVVSGQEVHTMRSHTDTVNAVAATGDGRLIVSASADTLLKVWDISGILNVCVPSGQEVHTLAGHTDIVYGVAVTNDGYLAISASRDTTLKVWDVASGQEVHTLVGHTNTVSGVIVMRDNLLAVSASSDNTLKVWNICDGRLLTTFWAGEALYTCAAAPDGVTIVAGGASGRLHFLRLENM